MPGLSSYNAQNVLNYSVGRAAMPALPTAFVALFTAAPSDSGGGTEATGGSYARVSTASGDWNAAANVGPSTISNKNAITFATATADWGTVTAFAAFDASAAGNMLWWDYLGNFSWNPATCTSVGSAAGTVVTSPAHGYSNGDFIATTVEFGGAYPTFTQGDLTGVCTVTGVTTDTFTVLSSGGSAVWTSSTGDFSVRKVTKQSIPNGVTASFASGSPGALVLSLT